MRRRQIEGVMGVHSGKAPENDKIGWPAGIPHVHLWYA
jgi:hypothetical protein